MPEAGLLAALAVLLVPAGAGAQPWVSIPPIEVSTYEFVSDVRTAYAMFTNPAGMASGKGSNMYLDLSGDRHQITEWVVALQTRAWGATYRHRDVTPDTFAGGPGVPSREGKIDTYVLSASFGPPVFQVGLSREWDKTTISGHDADRWLFGFQSHPTSILDLGGTIENIQHPQFLDGRLRPRYRYGLAIHPIPGRPRFLTLHLEGGHQDGEPDLIDSTYGVRIGFDSGVSMALVVRDPKREGMEIGFSITSNFGRGAVSARARTLPAGPDYRAQLAMQFFDQEWQEQEASETDVFRGYGFVGGR